MFRPDSNCDRTDYSSILMPPDGYRLDSAVGFVGTLICPASQNRLHYLFY